MASVILAMPEVFLYTGQERDAIPSDVTRVRVDPSVIRIPPGAFQNLRKLQEVEICEGVEEIGESAFNECVSLRRIKIPFAVTRIPDYAFYNCEKLEEVELCEGLVEIGANAFNRCFSLRRIIIPSTVARIPNCAFYLCQKLEEIELCEGLLEIGTRAFIYCKSLNRIVIPNTVRVIEALAFFCAALSSIDLPDGLEHIGNTAFYDPRFQHIRIPPLITEISWDSFSSHSGNYHFFSVELPEGLNQINPVAFQNCRSLRNIAIPSNAVIEDYAFYNMMDLEKLFVSTSRIKRELKQRFDGLPIHRMMYYQSYHTAETTLQYLNAAIDPRAALRRKLRSNLNPTGRLQDCLGMTPLHILACSAKQSLALYQVIVEKYPENLITADKWGALPILYALWGNAPREIMQFLIESHQARYPSHELNWGKMMETLSIGSPVNTVKNLLDIQRKSFPVQSIEWDKVLIKVLDKMEEPGIRSSDAQEESYRFLLQYSISERLDSIGVKMWRDSVAKEIKNSFVRRTDRDSVYSNLLDYETKFGELKEATSLLELVLWKKRINESNLKRQRRTERKRKKMKIDESGFRQQCRISCGAETVIENVLPYLLTS